MNLGMHVHLDTRLSASGVLMQKLSALVTEAMRDAHSKSVEVGEMQTGTGLIWKHAYVDDAQVDHHVYARWPSV